MNDYDHDIVMRLRNYYATTFDLSTKAADEIERLRERVRDLEKRHLDASFLLADWDGYYNPDAKQGNVEELASLIEDAYRILQNKSWRDADGQ